MKVIVKSLLGNAPKWIVNTMEVSSTSDLDKLIKAVITDRSVILTRVDGLETEIVSVGAVRLEVYNQKQLLVDWCNQLVDEFPSGGGYAKATI
jgi:hypothetical protein